MKTPLPPALRLLALLAAAALAMTATAAPPDVLTEEQVRNVITGWFATTNEHRPTAELLAFADDDIEFRYPDTPAVQQGHDALRAWYENILNKAFDETHDVVNWESIKIDGNRATVKLLVRWERREWAAGAARSRYMANFSWQTYELERDPATGRILVTKKTVDKFEPVAPIHQPAQ